MKPQSKKKNKPCKCPYCGNTAVLRSAEYIYGSTATPRHLYVCSKYPVCDAYVSVHEHSMEPMGMLANGNLRHKRIQTHKVFDKIWLNGIMTKSNAYRWMQDKFGMNEKQAHIANFSDFMCDQLIQECEKTLRNNRVI